MEVESKKCEKKENEGTGSNPVPSVGRDWKGVKNVYTMRKGGTGSYPVPF
jgi:hypothetical protein